MAGALGVGLLFSAACVGFGEDEGDDGLPVVVETARRTATPEPTAAPTPTPSPSPTATPMPVCMNNPDPAPGSLLQVIQPEPNSEVRVPFEVRGWGSTIGMNNAGVAVAIVDARQQTLQVLDVPPQPRAFRVPPNGIEITDNTRPFGADVVLERVVEPTRYCIWIYLETDEEGRPQSVVQVPITVVP